MGVLGLVTFALGYGSAAWRRRKRAPKPGDFESELASLENQSSIMAEAVCRLIKLTKIPKPSEGTWEPRAQITLGKWDKVKAGFSKFFHFGVGVQDNTIPSRIKKLETTARVTKRFLNHVSKFIEKGHRIPYQQQEQSESGVPSVVNESVRPDKIQPIANDDSLAAELFALSQSSARDGDLEIDRYSDSYDDGLEVRIVEQPLLGGPSQKQSDEDFIQLYNRAVIQSSVREEFREKYQPVRIGTVNAEERTRNPTIASEFRETTDGDFFALPIRGTDKCSVLPRLGLTIEAVSYGAGAVGEVFGKTSDYDPKLFYSRYAVCTPATFRKLGERWDLIEAGKLDLGQPD
jgi:hypothetical protein